MSTKFDSPIKTETALVRVWEARAEGARQANPAETPAPAPEAPQKPLPFRLIDPPHEVPDDGYDYFSIDRSLHMMAGMFEGIINLRYARRYGDVRVQAIDHDGLVFAMGFYPADVSAEEGEEFDVYENPDYFDAVRAFLTDIDQFTVGTSVDITLGECGFVGHSKLDIYKVLSEYLTSAEFAMGTPDSVYASDSALDHEPFVHDGKPVADKRLMADYVDAQRAERQREHVENMMEVFEALPRFRVFGGAPDPLFTVNNTPVSSMKEFYEECYLSGNADLPMSLGHLYQMICQEDGLNPQDFPRAIMGGKPTMGGYN